MRVLLELEPIYSYEIIWKELSIDLGNGLSPSIRQSKVCSNCDTAHWHMSHQAVTR